MSSRGKIVFSGDAPEGLEVPAPTVVFDDPVPPAEVSSSCLA